MYDSSRRDFIKKVMAGTALLGTLGPPARAARGRDFKISVAGWSLHNEVFQGRATQLELFKVVREEFDIGAFELVNQMLEVPTARYVNRLRREAELYNIEIPLIMVDGEGSLGGPRASERARAVRDHQKWLYIASDLGCHSVRVNWHSGEQDVAPDLIERSAEAFGKLAKMGAENGLNIVIENHGGPSSNPDLLVQLMKAVNSPHLGTLPDFGNFPDHVDRYGAVDRMMPYARAVSAKCHDFDSEGNETRTDFERMLEIVCDKHGYRGYIGIEYEGKRLSERDGIRACQKLLTRLRG